MELFHPTLIPDSNESCNYTPENNFLNLQAIFTFNKQVKVENVEAEMLRLNR